MEMSMTLYHAALVAHVLGITMMAGTTFIDFVTFRSFWRHYPTDRARGLIIADYLNGLQRFMGIGMLIILFSGVLMMVKFHEIWGAQIWFRIKMGILLLIVINGLGLRRAVGKKLKKMLAEDCADNSSDSNLSGITTRFTTVQAIQLILFIVVYTLSIFKFN